MTSLSVITKTAWVKGSKVRRAIAVRAPIAIQRLAVHLVVESITGKKPLTVDARKIAADAGFPKLLD